MTVELEVNGRGDGVGRYVSWAPSPCSARNAAGDGDLAVTLSSRPATAGGGRAVFFASEGAASQPTLDLTLPAGGGAVPFLVGGSWGSPSSEDGDCLLVVTTAGGDEVTVPIMVRVRKNANGLSVGERDRFLRAFAALNDRGRGVFASFRSMHVQAASRQEHGGPHFLAWHRSYLLDLERELQAIDPSVSLHYWRFDEPAPNVFRREFMGVSQGSLRVQFSPGHPLSTWITDGSDLGILRFPLFDPTNDPARFPITQNATLALGTTYPAFRRMEGRPIPPGDAHGSAHVSFRGWISDIPTAAKDPLFFMLHSNVDRLWALWQWLNRRTDPADPAAYTGQDEDGRRVGDTMWPWNQVTTPPRPDFAPGGALAGSPVVGAPGPEPTIGAMIDLQGHTNAADRLGFGYDDVPFEET